MADKNKLCFVISPIGDPNSDTRIHADWVLDGIIRPVMADFPAFVVKRADNDARPGLIDTQMIDALLNADLAIADLSLLNPNVFYEIGIRHMAQKPIIHMQLATEDPPFDVSLYRAIKFSRVKHRHRGYRSNNRRDAVFQTLVHTLGTSPDDVQTLLKAHNERNLAEYEGRVDVDEKLLEKLIGATTRLQAAVANLAPPPAE